MKKKVLIFPAGTEIALEILNALKYSKFLELFGGTSISDHSEFGFKNIIYGFPFVNEDSFLDFLNSVIEKYSIDCVYPAHDSVSVFLSKNRGLINAQCIIADYNTTLICRSKKQTYKLLKNESFIPQTFSNISEVSEYPVFVKPDIGQGSQGAIVVNTESELENALAKDSSLVICEFLPNEECTVDCFTDRHHILRVAKPRTRERVKAGISVRSRSVRQCEWDVDCILRIAKRLNDIFQFRGAWFFQLKKDINGKMKLLEVSPRIPGTMGLSRNCGINFPLLTLFDFWEYDIGILDNEFDIVVDRAFYNAYSIDIDYNHVYVDYDDTLIVDERINLTLLAYLYQAIENGKKIHLLSKHSGDLMQDLKRFRISSDIFDEIITINQSQEKMDYIKYNSAIFIDDSYQERKKILELLHIPVFDVDMVEGLLDWRM